MQSIVPSHQARVFPHAADLPEEVMHMLMKHEAAANVILPFVKKSLHLPRGGDEKRLWIVVYNNHNHVAFVLSCTKGPLGDYPVFIVASKAALQEERWSKHLSNSIPALARGLLDEVPAQRVFSVFSVARVTEAFAPVFEAEAHARGQTDIRVIKEPYYDATFSYCTSETLRKSSELPYLSWSQDVIIHLRRADMADLKELTVMCKAFSETSPPFVLDDARAESEARSLIEDKKVWVHTVQETDKEPEIACLVAATRESENVTAVTKVFTAEHWRGRGCAARLMRRVCEQILQEKQRVVLYVGNSDELAPARKVYHKIGFQGLANGLQAKDVERWVEIGFEGTNIGYW